MNERPTKTVRVQHGAMHDDTFGGEAKTAVGVQPAAVLRRAPDVRDRHLRHVVENVVAYILWQAEDVEGHRALPLLAHAIWRTRR